MQHGMSAQAAHRTYQKQWNFSQDYACLSFLPDSYLIWVVSAQKNSGGFSVPFAVSMDLLICAGLTIVELFVVERVWPEGLKQHSLPVLHTALFTFLPQYLTLKFYRIFLYHRYFSPLRHVPGPTVSSLDSCRGYSFSYGLT